MLTGLFERQAALQAQVDKYAPIREVFEEFLKAGSREDAGFLWWTSPGSRRSRFNWKRQGVLETAYERDVVVEAFTDPASYEFGYKAGDVDNALIGVRVSLPENPTVVKELELPPVWALLKQDPSTMRYIDLDRLEKDVEEIVPLVRAYLSQD